jgi:hypothetical protein
MLFSEVVNSSIFICAGDSLWRPERDNFCLISFLFKFWQTFIHFVDPKRDNIFLMSYVFKFWDFDVINDASLCETENCAHSGVGRWGDHRDYKSTICCHVGVSQIMLPCWDFTNYVAMLWSSQILFLVTKRKGKDVPV